MWKNSENRNETWSKSVEYDEPISCSDGANGFSVLSEQIRKSNHLQM